MTRKEQAIEIIRYGVSAADAEADNFVEANADPLIRGYGNAAVANLLEELGGCGVVQEVMPTFGSGGLGFAYRLNDVVIARVRTGDSVSDIVDDAFAGSSHDTVAALGTLLRRCREWPISETYKEHLLASLAELRTCFAQSCFIASLALSGKILEICLRQTLISQGIPFDEGWMIGKLLQQLREHKPDLYLDRSLNEVAAIINKSRISAVHTLEAVPVPTGEQAAMVIHAVIDTVKRTLPRLPNELGR